MMKKARVITQGIFLLLFMWLFIQTESKGADNLGYPVKIFLDADPLVLVSTLLSSHSLYKNFYLAVIVIIITVFLGRVFCGWVCPLGTLHDITGALKKKPDVPRAGWTRFKYLVLIFLLTASVFSLQLTGLVDPISLLVRSLSLSVYPLFSYAVNSAFDAVYSNVPVSFVVGVSEFAYNIFKKILLPFQQPYFLQSAAMGIIFFAVLGLNFIERRFWCKYLCPLGALLGLCSKRALLDRSVSEGCNECGVCANACGGGAVPDKKNGWKKTECIACMNCENVCPQEAVHFGFSAKKTGATADIGRRRIIGALAMGAIAAPLLKITPDKKAGAANPVLIRPPGAPDERQFLNKCVKCGECMKVCITNGLQPTLLEAGIEGIWSPVLVPRIGHCDYNCTLCGQVCPTGAIEKLTLAEKTKVKIGTAMIDTGRCLPYAHATPCLVCEEVCPVPKKAIWREEKTVVNRDGKKMTLNQPHIDLELCVGCGICEARCPVLGKPAIYVTSVGESRSDENKLLLT